ARRRRHTNPGFLERGDLRGRSAFAAADDGARVAHAASGRGGRAGDEARDRLFAILFDPLRRFLFGAAADFADHDDPVRVGIGAEHFNDVEVRRAVDRIAADADARALADAAFGQLPHGFI